MHWKLHGLIIGVLLLATACSGSQTSVPPVDVADDSGQLQGGVSLAVPTAIASARAINQDALFAEVAITIDGGEEQIQRVVGESPSVTFSAPKGSMLDITVLWYEKIDQSERPSEFSGDLLLARQAITKEVTGSTSISVEANSYFYGVEGDGSVEEIFDYDDDGITNFTELNSDTNPFVNERAQPPVVPDDTTAFDTIAASPDHQLFEELIIANGLQETLDNPDSPVTVFAPTDAALQPLVNGGALSSLTAESRSRFLLHHVLPEELQTGDLFDVLVSDQISSPFPSLAGAPTQYLTFTASNGVITVTDGTGSLILLDGLVNLNASTGNDSRTGIVHVIDSVLLPVTVGGSTARKAIDVRIPRIEPSEAPFIDGFYEDVWNNAMFKNVSGEELYIDNLMIDKGARRPNGDAPFRWFAMHDDINLFVFVVSETKEESFPRRDSTDVRQDTTVSLFIDGNNSKGNTFELNKYDGIDDRQILVPLLADLSNPAEHTSTFIRGYESAALPAFTFGTCLCDEGPYSWEFKIPLAEFNIKKGRMFGIEVQLDLDHDGADRDARWGWAHPPRTNDDVNVAWFNPSFFGTAILE